MARIVKRLYCARHQDQEVGAVIESVVYDGVTDNGEDYSVEQDTEYVPCPKCDAAFADAVIEGTTGDGF